VFAKEATRLTDAGLLPEVYSFLPPLTPPPDLARRSSVDRRVFPVY